MLFLLGDYRRGEFTESPDSLFEGLLRCTHVLTVLYFLESVQPLTDLVGTINSSEFLDVPPGHLLCKNCLVGKQLIQPGSDLAATVPGHLADRWLWHCRLWFTEQLAWAWNETLTAEGIEGKYRRRRIRFVPEADMARAFGGQRYFQLSAAPVRESGTEFDSDSE